MSTESQKKKESCEFVRMGKLLAVRGIRQGLGNLLGDQVLIDGQLSARIGGGVIVGGNDLFRN